MFAGNASNGVITSTLGTFFGAGVIFAQVGVLAIK